ncbi:MAG: hypothetical protein JG762_953, partial [Deferribacteraceae bacterium]|nr:hypothetical protein [Deferribacteraceae bacterium]
MSRPRLFGGKNLLVYLIVGYLFYFLYSYRLNNPLPVSVIIPETKLYTLDGKEFLLNDYKNSKFLIFFDKGSVYSPYYLKIIPDLKLIAQHMGIEIFVLIKKPKSVEELKQLFTKSKYKLLENITYSANINGVAKSYGIRSWPHFYMIDASNR